ncbi:MAG: hypothetical protein AB7C89_04855 [Intestinibacillus sp.]
MATVQFYEYRLLHYASDAGAKRKTTVGEVSPVEQTDQPSGDSGQKTLPFDWTEGLLSSGSPKEYSASGVFGMK